jgi:hypothetical protein
MPVLNAARRGQGRDVGFRLYLGLGFRFRIWGLGIRGSCLFEQALGAGHLG